jgi:hypothetical protein
MPVQRYGRTEIPDKWGVHKSLSPRGKFAKIHEYTLYALGKYLAQNGHRPGLKVTSTSSPGATVNIIRITMARPCRELVA